MKNDVITILKYSFFLVICKGMSELHLFHKAQSSTYTEFVKNSTLLGNDKMLVGK